MLSQYNIHECVGHCQQSNLMSYHLALGCVWGLMDVHVNTINTSSWTVYICIRLYTLDLIPEPEHGWIEDKSAFMHVCYMWCMGECLKKNTGYIQTCHLNFVECIWLDSELQSRRNSCWQHLKWVFCGFSSCYAVWHAIRSLTGDPNIMSVFPVISLEFSDSVLEFRDTETAIFWI